MEATLMVQRRVEDEGPRVVNSCHQGVMTYAVTGVGSDST